MKVKEQIRQDVKKECSRILYEDNRYLIGVSNQETDSHNLLVNDVYAFLDRGIFKELARADVKRLRSSLEMVAQPILNEMLGKSIPLEELGWALAKAAIRDEEDYAEYLSQSGSFPNVLE